MSRPATAGAERAAGGEGLAADRQPAEGDGQRRAGRREQHDAAGELGPRRGQRPHPEVVPADDDERGRQQVGAVAEHLEGELGEQRADAAAEVARLAGRGAEEQHRVVRRVAGEADHPQQGEAEEGHAEHFAEATRQRGVRNT